MNQEGKRNYMDDYFRDKLFDYESPAPEDMWMKIDNQIKRKKLIVTWTIISSFAASIIIIISIGVGYYFGSRHLQVSKNNYVETASKEANSEKNNKDNRHTYVSENKKLAVTKLYHVNVENKNSTKIYSYNTTVDNNKKAGSENNISENVAIQNSKQSIVLLNKIEPRQVRLGNNFNKNTRGISRNKLFILPETNQYAEAQPKKASSKATWVIGSNGGPLYSSLKVENNNGLYPDDFVSSIEEPVIAYKGGFNVSIETNRWRFGSGIYYSGSVQNLDKFSNDLAVINVKDLGRQDKNYATSNLATSSRVNIDAYMNNLWKPENTSNITIYTNSNLLGVTDTTTGKINYKVYSGSNNTSYIIVSSVNNKSNYITDTIKSLKQLTKSIEIPLIAEYKIIDRKLDIYISGGLATNILISNKTNLNLKDDVLSLGPTQYSKTYSFSGIFGLALEAPLTRKINFRFEPRLSYSLNSIDKNNNISIHPYSFGIFSGISFHF